MIEKMEQEIKINEISNKSNTLESSFGERLLKSEDLSLNKIKSFEVEIISKRTNIYKSDLIIDYTLRQIIIKTTQNSLEIMIKFNDFLAFILENRMPEIITNEIKLEIGKKNKKLLDFFVNKRLAHLNFFPKFKTKNCCRWVCCKCNGTKVERRPKNLELLVGEENLEEISSIFNKITMEDTIHPELTVKRKYLLYVNPIGGHGAAIKVWNQVKHIFAISSIEIEVFHTQYYKHAYENTLTMNFRNYHGVICCSGDGIVHEVINAIFHREDKDDFLRLIPIGVIPGGTSNGYAKSICEDADEICNPENCSFIICKGQVKEVDIQEIEFVNKEKKVYSFLSIAWGLIADIDLESETCRCCGPIRFTMYGAIRWISLRNIFGALYYLPQNSKMKLEDIPSINSSDEIITRTSINDDGFIRENAHYYYFIACNTPYLGENINCAPKSRLNDGFSDLIKIKNTAGKYNLLKQLFNQDTGDYFNASGEIPFYTGLEYVKTKCWRLIPKVNIDQDDNVREQRHLPRHYSIDGERYNIEPIQVKTLSKALKVFYFDMSKY